MAPRKTVQTEPGRTAWGSVDWSHAPVARLGWSGMCTHCGELAVMKHPITGVACHKICDDAHQARQQ